MDKIRGYSMLGHFKEDIVLDGKQWSISSEWGTMLLSQIDMEIAFCIDRQSSSVPNTTLILEAIKGKTGTTITFDMREDKEKCMIKIHAASEVLTYVFNKIPFSNWKMFMKEIEALDEKLTKLGNKAPVVGKATLTNWKEYGLVDLVADFDYSFIKLEQPPIIFFGAFDGTCFVTAGNKTKSECKVHLRTFVKADPSGIPIKYCIFPINEETKVTPMPEIPPIDEEKTLNSYESLREANKNGRQLVAYEERVVDAGRFLTHHPGESPPIEYPMGREVSRWFFGSIHSAGSKHQHGDDADQLMLKYKIGTIQDKISEEFHVGIEPGRILKDYIFASTIERITDVHNLIKMSRPPIACAPNYDNVCSFGRYYSVYSPYLKMSRNMCCVICAGDRISKEHRVLANAIENKLPYKRVWEEKESAKPEYIPLICKAIGKFSTWLGQDAPPGTKFIMRGPFVSVNK